MKKYIFKNSELINIFMEGSWGTQPCQGSLKKKKIKIKKKKLFFKIFKQK